MGGREWKTEGMEGRRRVGGREEGGLNMFC